MAADARRPILHFLEGVGPPYGFDRVLSRGGLVFVVLVLVLLVLFVVVIILDLVFALLVIVFVGLFFRFAVAGLPIQDGHGRVSSAPFSRQLRQRPGEGKIGRTG